MKPNLQVAHAAQGTEHRFARAQQVNEALLVAAQRLVAQRLRLVWVLRCLLGLLHCIFGAVLLRVYTCAAEKSNLKLRLFA